MPSGGSSPPTRGTRVSMREDAAARRFIPAHAGNTAGTCAPGSRCPVHPRPRGEHFSAEIHERHVSGSSPPTRGTLFTNPFNTASPRFIPAHAVNTSIRYWPRLSATVHPRPRGEHLKPAAGRRRIFGSSPPTRGTRMRNVVGLRAARFIPAHAGNTSACSSLTVSHAVHPRPRGEHDVVFSPETIASGSSPPTRGTPAPAPMPTHSTRFIPAHAGNTLGTAIHAGTAIGSSPPTRGTLTRWNG